VIRDLVSGLCVVEQNRTNKGTNPTSKQEHDLPTQDQVRKAIKPLKKNKSASMDNIPSEVIKYGGAQLAKAITGLIKWRTKKMPNENQHHLPNPQQRRQARM